MKHIILGSLLQLALFGHGYASSGEAMSFLQSRANLVKFRTSEGVRTWSVYKLRQEGTVLKWQESDTFLDNKGLYGTSKLEDYSVDVHDMSMPAVIEGKTIKFECKLNACLAVRVHTSVTISPDLKHAKPEDVITMEQRTTNTWYFHSVDDAKRAANAMNDLLKELGATARIY